MRERAGSTNLLSRSNPEGFVTSALSSKPPSKRFILVAPKCVTIVEALLFISASLGRPILAKLFGLLQNRLSGLLLLVRRVAVLAQDALDHCPHLGADALFHRPVNCS